MHAGLILEKRFLKVVVIGGMRNRQKFAGFCLFVLRREIRLNTVPIGFCPYSFCIIPEAFLKFSSLTIDSVFIYIGIGIHFNSRWF